MFYQSSFLAATIINVCLIVLLLFYSVTNRKSSHEPQVNNYSGHILFYGIKPPHCHVGVSALPRRGVTNLDLSTCIYTPARRTENCDGASVTNGRRDP